MSATRAFGNGLQDVRAAQRRDGGAGGGIELHRDRPAREQDDNHL
jgi:hypothetical protein